MTEIARRVETIRSVRGQLEARAALLAGDARNADLLELGKQIAAKLTAVEEKLHNPTAEVTYDILVGRDGGAQLHSRYAWLDWGSKEHPGPPTQGMLEVMAMLDEELAVQRKALDELRNGDLARLQALAAERGLGYVVGGNDPG